jgi:2'-5' RNA ligase
MVGMAIPPFKVDLKDFGSFPSHTIFINVAAKAAIKMLVKSIKAAQSLLKTGNEKPYFIEEAYVPVARRLLPWQYEKAWIEYSNSHFKGGFIARNMLLLRRSEGMKSFQPVHKFEFMNLPVVTTQGQLFG